jgi:F-type H+-transporting ATPase subunit a
MTDLLTLLAAADPLGHVVNLPAVKSASGYWLWSGNQGNLVLSGIIVIVVGLWVASKIKTGRAEEGADAYITTNRFAHFIEVMCTYLRDEVIRPLLGDRTGKFTPILITFFFFILVNNLLGLTPIRDLIHLIQAPFAGDHAEGGHAADWIGGTATQNIWVTGTLAVLSALLFNAAALVRLGPVGFVKHMMGGLPWYMFPIALLLLIIEAAGQFLIKPFALALRLFANMTAGHVLIATLLIFAGGAISNLSAGVEVGGSLMTIVISFFGTIALMFLELFVAFLQAFVFMFLTTIFISLMDHHDEHGHEHGHDHASGHEHAHAAA